MGQPVFLRHIESDRGTLGNGSWQAGLPLANLRTTDLQQVARSTNALTTSTVLRVDWGTTVTRYADVFALLGTNLTFSAKVRFVLTNSATDATARALDSGLIDALPSTAVWSADPWGGFSWTGGALADGTLPPGIVLYRHPSRQTARYLFVYIEDTANPDGYVQVGRLLAGPGWSPGAGFSYGNAWSWVDPSVIRRTPGGLRVVERRPRYREFTGLLGFLTQAEAFGFMGEWGRAGLGQDCLFIQNPDDPGSLGQRRVIYAALKQPPRIVKPFLSRVTVELVLEELT